MTSSIRLHSWVNGKKSAVSPKSNKKKTNELVVSSVLFLFLATLCPVRRFRKTVEPNRNFSLGQANAGTK